jgi:outer membrane protein TolC
MNLPIFRRFQGERARAEGDRNRSSTQARVHAQVIAKRLETIRREVMQTRLALDTLESATMPAAKAALAAATELRRAGKADYLPVLIARREVTSLSLRRIDLSQREWDLLGEWVEYTGSLP